MQAKLTYETSLANAESAKSKYEAAISQAESDYRSLMDGWEDARENLELFENCVGDGYFYASGSGTVLRTMVRTGQGLASQETVFLYSNPEKMTVTVSVDQADISGIALGDSVYIQSSEHGSFAGVVTEVDPISNSSSRTSVTYNVTVTFTGDIGELPANESVTVIFGDAERMMPQIPAGGAFLQSPEGEAGWSGGGMQGMPQNPQNAGRPQGSGNWAGAGMEQNEQAEE